MQTEHKHQDGRADFDFFIGHWKVHNRRLRERLKGSTAWEEFEGTAVARKVLGGLGNTDEVSFERESGRLEGMTLRLYDPQSQQWSLYWADNVTSILQTPMVGGFENGRGEFFAQEIFAGKSIFSRFIWSEITDSSCRWEQAFSSDGGKTWETNWIMEFTRQPEAWPSGPNRGGGHLSLTNPYVLVVVLALCELNSLTSVNALEFAMKGQFQLPPISCCRFGRFLAER